MFRLVFILLLQFLVITNANAFRGQRPLAKSPGFGLDLSLSAAYFVTKSQLNTDEDNRVTDNLNNSGKSTGSVFPFPLFKASYTTQSLQTQYFIGNTRSNVGRGNVNFEAGVTHQISRIGKFTLAAFPEIRFLNETWEDPFVINQARNETKETVYGLRTAWDNFLGLPMNLKYAYAKNSIDSEMSGEFLFNQGSITQNEKESLNRKGDFQRYTLELFIPIAKGTFFIPAYYQTVADLNGDSQSYIARGGRLTSIFGFNRHRFVTTLTYEVVEFDSINPVFNKVQDDKKYSLFGIYTYKEPFKLTNTSFLITLIYSNNRSNIEFYDSETKGIAAGFSLKI